MNHEHTAEYLFETSWEVCNKVGGIYTVLKTKLKHAVDHFGDRYFLIGPDIGNNPEFEESERDLWNAVRPELEKRNLRCRFGHWNTPGMPSVILVNFNNKYKQDSLLFELWKDYGVDSMSGAWDYIEPVLFSTAYGEVIEVLYNNLVAHNGIAVAQFHEWMSTAGMLYLKKHVPEIATVYTSHATMLGRSLSGHGVEIYSDMENIAPDEMAVKMNVVAKHSLETASARESDCFTTVSEITAREATYFLHRKPQVLLPNGINISDIPDYSDGSGAVAAYRQQLLDFAHKFLHREKSEGKTKILLISGRYEFHNKGINLFLESLARIRDRIKESQSQDSVIALLCVIGGHYGVSKDVQRALQGEPVQLSGISKICTHQLQDSQHDPIWNKCNELNLLNNEADTVNVIFMPVYLDGFDGLLNMPYYDVVAGCDLCVFPSFYEPWGYTPLESAALSVPTITTDLSGFGMWISHQFSEDSGGVLILKRQKKTYEEILTSFTDQIWTFLQWSENETEKNKRQARLIAEKASWKEFYPCYLDAYDVAEKNARERMYTLDTSAYTREVFYAGIDSVHPRFRQFSVSAEMPKNISQLRDIAYNLLWSWNPEARELFRRIDPDLWEDMMHNPIEVLERVHQDRLLELADDDSYLDLYNQVVSSVNDLLLDAKSEFEEIPALTRDKPIAYFSTEYGLSKILPIYSGGLGILSGDHLKSASNLNMPMVGIGLLYKNGYFYQQINKEGNQITSYPENDFSRMPVRVVDSEGGEALKIEVDLPGRKLFAQVWKIDVGRIPLYLMDTFVPENSPQDREITSRLYGADQRLRIEQEIMLGIGGIRLLDKLKINPSLYHLNEGHSAFLLIERVRQLMQQNGMNFYEAREMVKASSIFTTHSPVEAANERFDESLMKHYFSNFVQDAGISWESFWELGREEPGEGKPFMMPVLALKLCCFANAVSRLHGTVARRMWQNTWSGFKENETPIGHITNGIHIQSWIADEMHELFKNEMAIDCNGAQIDLQPWDRIKKVSDTALWETHMVLKERMIDYCRSKITHDMEWKGLSPSLIKTKIESLNPDALIIGFARRFASYKRALLLFSDPERLERILGDPECPVQIIFAGKAHPSDDEGKRLLKVLYSYAMDERFIERIFFLEDYDMDVAAQLVQGVDVWLNTPIRPQEASGTSGMKGIANGVLNCSILDGWWDEAYNGKNGWAIGTSSEYANREMQDLIDSQSLYDTLEYSVIPHFFKRSGEGIPEEWIAMIKESIETLVPRFNTHRMLREYYSKMYHPAAQRAFTLAENNYEKVKVLADWKLKIASRFSTVHIKWVAMKGLKGDSLKVGDKFEVEVGIEIGRLSESEVRAEIVVERADGNGMSALPFIVPMTLKSIDRDKNEGLFRGSYRATEPGKFVYGVRLLPNHPHLLRYQELGLVHWA